MIALASILLTSVLPCVTAAQVAESGRAVPAAVAATVDAPAVRWSAPTVWVEGQPFVVTLEVEGGRTASSIATWLLTPSAFTLDGKPLTQRDDQPSLPLPAGARLQFTYDLSPALRPALEASSASATASAASPMSRRLKLDYAPGYAQGEPILVDWYSLADQRLDWLSMPLEKLNTFGVVLETRHGPMVFELWPDVAPNHVRNFLDLVGAGFYDGTIFHRVIPGFMIQGGSPDGSPTGRGPRTVDLEPSTRPHIAGVLSMARSQDKNSATSQFFVMHGASPKLDGEYSAFGKLLHGSEAVDAIATTPRDRADRPVQEQKIERARVVRLPAKVATTDRESGGAREDSR